MKEFFRENFPYIALGFAIGVAGRFVYDEMNRAKPDHIVDANKMVIDAEQDRMIANMDARLRKIESKRD